MRRLIIASALVVSGAFALGQPAHAQDQYRVDCMVFEDDSFVCGVVNSDPEGWSVDTTHDWVEGCIPEGLCDHHMGPVELRRHKGKPLTAPVHVDL
jgi:hypothetical protein